MADKHYIYDSEGRRALQGKHLLEYYEIPDNKSYYVQLARDLHRALVVPDSDPPLVGDVFVLMFGALKGNGRFIEALLEEGVSLERAANKWFSYFAWLVVLKNWNQIARRRRQR